MNKLKIQVLYFGCNRSEKVSCFLYALAGAPNLTTFSTDGQAVQNHHKMTLANVILLPAVSKYSTQHIFRCDSICST